MNYSPMVSFGGKLGMKFFKKLKTLKYNLKKPPSLPPCLPAFTFSLPATPPCHPPPLCYHHQLCKTSLVGGVANHLGFHNGCGQIRWPGSWNTDQATQPQLSQSRDNPASSTTMQLVALTKQRWAGRLYKGNVRGGRGRWVLLGPYWLAQLIGRPK